MDPAISVEEELVNKILRELGGKPSAEALCKDLIDPVCTNTVLIKLDSPKELEKIRREIAEAFVVSSWTQRVYFDVRSIIMTIFGAIITLVVFWRIDTVNVAGDFLLGFSTYFIALVLSRLFDSKIVQVSRNFLRYIEGHNRLRDFIVKNF